MEEKNSELDFEVVDKSQEALSRSVVHTKNRSSINQNPDLPKAKFINFDASDISIEITKYDK